MKAEKNSIEQGYLSLKEAAEYTGYQPKYFSRLALEYAIPKYGPKSNRFSRIDLDFFMSNPTYFQRPEAQPHVRRPGVFTPLSF